MKLTLFRICTHLAKWYIWRCLFYLLWLDLNLTDLLQLRLLGCDLLLRSWDNFRLKLLLLFNWLSSCCVLLILNLLLLLHLVLRHLNWLLRVYLILVLLFSLFFNLILWMILICLHFWCGDWRCLWIFCLWRFMQIFLLMRLLSLLLIYKLLCANFCCFLQKFLGFFFFFILLSYFNFFLIFEWLNLNIMLACVIRLLLLLYDLIFLLFDCFILFNRSHIWLNYFIINFSFNWIWLFLLSNVFFYVTYRLLCFPNLLFISCIFYFPFLFENKSCITFLSRISIFSFIISFESLNLSVLVLFTLLCFPLFLLFGSLFSHYLSLLKSLLPFFFHL